MKPSSGPAIAGMARRRSDLGLALVLVSLVWLVFRCGGSQVSDSRFTLLIAERLISERTYHLDAVPGVTADPVADLGLELLRNVNGHTYHYFPPGTPLLTVPLFGVGRLFGASVFDERGVYDLGREIRLHRRIAPLLMAALVGVIFFTSRLALDPRWSLVAAGSAAFGSQIWSTASRGLWSHSWGILLVGVAIFLLLRAESGARSSRPALVASLLSWACFCRPLFAIPAAFVGMYLAIARRSELPVYAGVSVGWWLGFVAFSLHFFGSWIPAYYQQAGKLGSSRFVEALAGNLVSPSRGLLVYTPLVWVCAFLVARFWRQIESRRLALLSLAILTAHLLAISSFGHWWGGWSYGSRLTTDLVPWFALLGILGLRGWRRHLESEANAARSPALRALAVAILAASVLINANGALWSRALLWNAEPEIDTHPERLWDWRQPQFLFPFVGSERQRIGEPQEKEILK